MRRRDARKLVGDAWLRSDYRIAWETRVMRRRILLYKTGIAGLRALNRLSPAPRPSLAVFHPERTAPGGRKVRLAKMETMSGAETRDPVTGADLYRRTSLASRLARAISADEWPQIIEEYQRRKAGLAPRYHYVGHRPLNDASHALMDKAWAKGEIPTERYRTWLAEVKNKDHGALYSKFFTHGGARDFPGAEANPGFRKARVKFDVAWKSEASLAQEKEVLRRARILRARQLVVFAKREIAHATGAKSAPGSAAPPPARTGRPDPYTPEVVAAVAEFVKPTELRGKTARRTSVPNTVASSATAVAASAAQGIAPIAASAAAGGAGRTPRRQPAARAEASLSAFASRPGPTATRIPAPGRRLTAEKRRA